jgi:hypothetical protein
MTWSSFAFGRELTCGYDSGFNDLWPEFNFCELRGFDFSESFKLRALIYWDSRAKVSCIGHSVRQPNPDRVPAEGNFE